MSHFNHLKRTKESVCPEKKKWKELGLFFYSCVSRQDVKYQYARQGHIARVFAAKKSENCFWRSSLSGNHTHSTCKCFT